MDPDTYGPASYGEGFADVYDDWYADITDVDAAVRALTELAGGRPVLELGVGTGRVAIPLARSGATVVGLDASPAMLARLAAKPGARGVATVLADMAILPVGTGTFGLVFAAFNTFFNLTSRDAQRSCAAAARRALCPGGHLVVEAFVPPADGLRTHGLSVDRRGPATVVTASVHDPATQHIRGQHVVLDAHGATPRPWQLSYLTPDQLDELLAGAGFGLHARWADWSRRPFDRSATAHVSVYRPAEDVPLSDGR